MTEMRIKVILFSGLLMAFSILIMTVIILFMCANITQKPKEEDNPDFGIERMYIEDNIYEASMNNGLELDLPWIHLDTVFVCYYSAQSCGICVEYALNKIKESFEPTDMGQCVWFLTSDFNPKMKFSEEGTINLGKKKSGLKIEGSMYVCYFLLINGKVQHLFIPEKKFPNYTDIYLKTMKKRYF